MADEELPSIEQHVWAFYGSSYQPFAPKRSMPNQGFSSGSFNGMDFDGVFRRRGSVTVDALAITVNSNGAFADGWNGQSPADIQVSYFDPLNSTTEGPVLVFLTTSECWVYESGTLTNVTPRYSTGTISITTGTATLTGVGTNWQSVGIVAGQLVNLPNGGANWYSIASVDSNTQITLKTNLSTATLSGQPYTIRRTGRDSGAPLAGAASSRFARIFNGDLYYTYIEGNSNACVVKVTDVLNAPTATPTIIGANVYNNLSGCDVWFSGSGSLVTEIKGLELMTDGRVVIATSENLGPGLALSRVRYSSHLDQMVWNDPPGGFTDVVNLPAKMNAFRDFGAYFACHYDSGIVLAVPTGQDDPPLNFQRVQTTRIGCLNPRAIANTPSGQMYLGPDGNVYVFDGSGHQIVTDAPRARISLGTSYGSWHACYEQAEDTFWLFDTRAGAAGTEMYAIQAATGKTAYHKTGTIITAAADSTIPADLRLHLGLPSYDPAGSGTGGVTSTMLYDLDWADAADVVPAFTGMSAPAALTIITDWLDFGKIGVDKTLDRVEIFYESTGSYTARLTAKRDGLSSANYSFASATTSSEQKFAKFFFDPKTSEKWQFTLDTTNTSAQAWDFRPQFMIIYYRTVANSAAVPR